MGVRVPACPGSYQRVAGTPGFWPRDGARPKVECPHCHKLVGIYADGRTVSHGAPGAERRRAAEIELRKVRQSVDRLVPYLEQLRRREAELVEIIQDRQAT